MSENNYTFAMIKPMAIKKHYTGAIIKKIEEAGFTITEMRMTRLSRELAEKFYEMHKGKDFFNNLIDFITSGPVIVMKLEKENAVADFRKLMGATNPEVAEENTIRRLFGTSVTMNAIHGSDSPENAKRECSFFFD